MMRILCQIIGSVFAIFGMAGLVLPVPFGLIIGMALLVVGLLFLIPTTPMVTRWVRRARTKAAWFDRGMSNMTDRLPATYRRIFKQTEIDIYEWR